MATDQEVSTNELKDLLIDGDNNITGIKEELDTIFSNKDIVVVPQHPSYLRESETDLKRPLDKPYVSIYFPSRDKDRFYRQDKVPKTSRRGWLRRYLPRVDIWARTPPEVEDITDALDKIFVRLRESLWTNYRIKLELSIAQAAPFEEDIGIYRNFFSGVITVFVTDDI